MNQEKSALDNLKDALRNFWRKYGKPSIVAAKHTDFIIEPTIFVGDKLNPEILKLLTMAYLANASRQDSGFGNIDVTPEKLVIKSSKGRPLVVVNDQKIIRQYVASCRK
ncbi:MAG: hypothetical protein QME05_04765 [Candidatus Margulisbacteria bacterium]|nr:hypothetical protein [Candidatus Margulisiibacteriota bacterium]